MRVQINISIQSVNHGKNKNWIELEALVGFFDKNRLYKIEFCGTELNSSIPLTDKQEESLKGQLINDFGYAPYDVCKAKKVIENGKDYIIPFNK